MRILALLFATMLLPTKARATGFNDMTAIEINKFQLVGAEYWPFLGNEPFQYPSDVLWGFYPDSASNEVIVCAEKSYAALVNFFQANWRLMREVVALGATRRFYLWTNDYSEAATNRVPRKARMWHWNSGSPDYSQGYWKWEATLTLDGDCAIPTSEQIRIELNEAINVLSK